MLTPDDMQKKIFALGRKLENNDVGMFVKELQINYQFLYNEVNEQKAQIKGMEAKLQHYRNIESSLQEAMVSAEKMSEQKLSQAEQKAKEIEKQAYKKADNIICDAQKELETIKSDIQKFKDDYLLYQDKYREFVSGQMKFIEEAKRFMLEESVDIKPLETSSFSEPLEQMNDEKSVDNSGYVSSVGSQSNYNTDFFENADLEEKEVSAKSEENVRISSYANLNDANSETYTFDMDTSIKEEKEELDDTIIEQDTSVANDKNETDIEEKDIEVPNMSRDIPEEKDIEVPSMSMDIPQEKDIEVPSMSMDIPEEKDIEVPSMSMDISKEDIEVPSMSVDIPEEKDIEVPSMSMDIPEEKDIEVPSMSMDIPKEDIEVPSMSMDIPKEDIEVPSMSMDIPEEKDIEVPSMSMDIPEEDIEVPSMSMDIPEEKDIEVPSMSMDTPEEKDIEVPSMSMAIPEVEDVLEPDIKLKDNKEENIALKATIKSIMTPIVDNISMDNSLEDVIAGRQNEEEIEEFVLPNLAVSEELPDFNTVNEQIEITDLNNNMIDDSIEVDFEDEFGSEIKEHEFELPQIDMDGMGFDDIQLLDDNMLDVSNNENNTMELPNIDDIGELPNIENSVNQQSQVANGMPDLSINNNIELVNINKSLYSKTRKKEDKNAEILKSMNLTPKKKEDPLLDLPPKPNMESFFSQELLASNMKMMQESMEKQQEENMNQEMMNQSHASRQGQMNQNQMNQNQMNQGQMQGGVGNQPYNGPTLQNNQMMQGGLGNQSYNGPTLQDNQVMQGGLGNQPYNGPTLQDNQVMQGGLGNQPYNGPSLQDSYLGQQYNGPSLQNRF